MKVGILTFHRAHNCGAMLQNYALQTVLARMGVEAKTIDFNDIGEERRFSGLSGLTVKQHLRRLINFFFSIGFFDSRLARFNRFRQKFLNCTDWVFNQNSFPEFDYYIVGSDQVFQPNLTKQYCEAFLLKNVSPEKRISYAASFGYDTLPEEFRTLYVKCLSRFKAVSVREDTGKNIIHNELKLDIPVETVLDPTLLLDAGDYDKIETKFQTPDRYVLVYSIGGAEEKLRKVAKTIADKKGIQVVYVNACRRHYFDIPFSDLITTSPDRLVYLIRHAEYVVTTSFHGVAFSLVYKRQFSAILPGDSKVAGRIPALLKSIGILSRALSDKTSLDAFVALSESKIDYLEVDRCLQRLQIASIDFLKKALGL